MKILALDVSKFKTMCGLLLKMPSDTGSLQASYTAKIGTNIEPKMVEPCMDNGGNATCAAGIPEGNALAPRIVA